jgi:hypothetical protein
MTATIQAPDTSRTAHVTSRLMDYFTEAELTRQIGHSHGFWAIAMLKEVIDNSLDACEEASIPPEIAVTISPDGFTVADNGPGIPTGIIQQSVDYTVRVSSKRFYIRPARGQLGNALKCLGRTVRGHASWPGHGERVRPATHDHRTDEPPEAGAGSHTDDPARSRSKKWDNHRSCVD